MSRYRLPLLGSLVVVALSFLLAAVPPSADWKAVQEAIDQGLPKTAIEKLEPIVAKAMEEKNYDEAIKAISLRISLQGNIEGNKPEEKITRMRSEIEQAPAEMKPVMEAILANWFWHYFQQNNWRFLQRTSTAGDQADAKQGDDIETWDLRRILGEIDAQFQRALSAEQLLKQTPSSQYDQLLEKGTAPHNYRPTLYDVLAHNALEFYSAGEQAGSRVQDAFDLQASSPIFAPVAEFVAWDPKTDDIGSLTLRAVGLYQSLLRFHADDEDPAALLDADLLRLNFGNNTAVGEEKTVRYKAALRRFADQYASHEISSRALHHLAETVHGENDWVEAHKIATEGLNRHPDSVGGRRCFNLIQQIEAPQSQITTERVWNDPQPSIDVQYRNLEKVYFRLVPLDFAASLQANRWQPEQLDRRQRGALLVRRPVQAWSATLPKTDDYQQRVESIQPPGKLAPGSYFLIASHNAQFSDEKNQVSFTEVWQSDLAIVTRSHQRTGNIGGLVLQADSGQPIAGATIQPWQFIRHERWQPLQPTKTDRDGMFTVPTNDQWPIVVLATHQKQSLSSTHYLQSNRNVPENSIAQTRFFTDRALYRPGQTIHYKGICLLADSEQDNYQTLPRRDVTVVFADANGEEIERRQHRTNDYGSFSGSVTAPRDRLMGEMSLHVPDGPHGSVRISVEEYKRPKFQVELKSPEVAAKLGDTVQLKGQATAYTGVSISDAGVSWRVVREVRFPPWWHWRSMWFSPGGGDSQEIAHGTATTDAAGGFEIEFVARPDASVPADSEPTFVYSIEANVTDTTGETRSAERTIRVGYTALAASMSTESWLTEARPVTIQVHTKTLDGEGQSASGVVKIYHVQQPDAVQRAPLTPQHQRRNHGIEPAPDPNDPNGWPLGDLVQQLDFETDGAGDATLNVDLTAGLYRAVLETTDRFGKAVTAQLPLQVLDPDADQLPIKLPNLVAVESPTIEPGQTLRAVWGSGYDKARAYVEIEHRGKTLQSYWTDPEVTQTLIEQPVDESMRGGFTLRVTMVRQNRAYLVTHHIDVPWTNKQLTLKWEHFVSKLQPAAKETWTAIIQGPDAQQHAAEMVAALYDASLDAFRPHDWPSGFGVFRQDYSYLQSTFENTPKHLNNIHHSWSVAQRDAGLSYWRFPSQIIQNFVGYQYFGRGGAFGMAMPMAAESAMMGDAMGMQMKSVAPAAAAWSDAPADAAKNIAGAEALAAAGQQPAAAAQVDLQNVSARQNLNETAFFFPHLIAGDDGSVRMEFTMPEALTQWNFLGFAHDNQLRGGLLTGTTVTAKDLMVQPNPPRFLREGDVVEFTVKVSNQSPTRQSGSVRLTFADARSDQSMDQQLGNESTDQSFELAAGQSKSLAWRISVPDGMGFLKYQAVASTGKLSDGEEGWLPVLPRRILVTESLTLPIRGAQTKQFEFEKLLQSGQSDSLQHQALTVQMVSNPSWYAVLALPYLMEFPHECSEQVFNRLYANALAKQIAGNDPKIHRVFEQWRGTPALDSPLEKNEELKAVMLEETPWVRQANRESQARRNVGVLFDDNRMQSEFDRALFKLTQMQRDDGAWPWFPGGPANDYITLYVTTGFGRLRHLGVEIDTSAAIKSLNRLDGWMTRRYEGIKTEDREKNHLDPTVALYLYGRSFFLADQAITAEHQVAVDYWLGQATKFWLQVPYRQSQGHLAVALKRFGKLPAAQAIMKSIKERSVSDEEMGMFWRDTEIALWWYRAPIETQAMMIEAFDEVMNDAQAVEECKVWLLKQKQTQDWKTTKATADAVYALLLRGSDLLASDELVQVTLGDKVIEPESVEAGTGFYEQRFVRGEVESGFGEITVKKVDDGVAWGSVHWQYLEDMAKVTPHEATPLTLTKQLFVKQYTDKGPVLNAVDGPVAVGDELVVRMVLRTDRDMEYVHLKDHRGSGTEPVNVLSQYKYQDGLAYYESTRDTATHFFIDYMPKGTYVFEYSTRVQLRGEYQSGIANIQCMYAPEFGGHSESVMIEVGDGE